MPHLTRRQWLRTAATGAAALALSPRAARAAAPGGAPRALPPGAARAADAPGFPVPPLPYAFGALEPHIDARTMEIHHDKHHAAYVKNLNAALAKYPDLLKRPVDDLMRDLAKLPVDDATRTAVRNNGGGHSNHSHFWTW